MMDATATDIILPQTIQDAKDVEQSFERAKRASKMYIEQVFKI